MNAPDLRQSCVDYVARRMAAGWNKHEETRRSVSDFQDEAEREINDMTNIALLDLIDEVNT